MELSAATFAFVPGLLSDRIVWEPLAEQLSENPFHADLTAQSSIPEMADSVLASTQGNLVVAGHSMGGCMNSNVSLKHKHYVVPTSMTGAGCVVLENG